MISICIVTSYLTLCKAVEKPEFDKLFAQCNSQPATVCEVTKGDDDYSEYDFEIKQDEAK